MIYNLRLVASIPGWPRHRFEPWRSMQNDPARHNMRSLPRPTQLRAYFAGNCDGFDLPWTCGAPTVNWRLARTETIPTGKPQATVRSRPAIGAPTGSAAQVGAANGANPFLSSCRVIG